MTMGKVRRPDKSRRIHNTGMIRHQKQPALCGYGISPVFMSLKPTFIISCMAGINYGTKIASSIRKTVSGALCMDLLFNKTIEMLTGVLNFRSARHEAITSNIANIDTPGYRPRDVAFQREVQALIDGEKQVAMVRTNGKHLPGAANSGDAAGLEVIESGDTVDLDKEMAKLAENNLMYNLTVELLARKFKGLNSVLTEAK